MTDDTNPYEARLALFSFFPYMLALALGFIAQTVMWSYEDLADAGSLLHIGGGILIWLVALLIIAIGDKARQIVVHGADRPWDKPSPGILDRLLMLCLRYLGVFLIVLVVITIFVISLPLR